MQMDFEWDEANLSHLARHKVTREMVHELFCHDPILYDFEAVDGEPRWHFIGHTDSLKVLTVIVTETTTGRDRVITAYKAERGDQVAYWEEKGQI